MGHMRKILRSSIRRIREEYRYRVDRAPLTIDTTGFTGVAKAVVDAASRSRFKDIRTGLAGWLYPNERRMLYGLARNSPGPITEIGSWVGLSTIAIAKGIVDSQQTKKFYSFDLPLTVDNFRPLPDGRIGMFVDGQNKPMGACSQSSYFNEILPILEVPGGPRAVLMLNLKRYKVSDIPIVITNDFKACDPIPSFLLFCDALHDEAEINVNAPRLRPFLISGGIFACHDIGQLPCRIKQLTDLLPLRCGVSVDNLYIAQVN